MSSIELSAEVLFENLSQRPTTDQMVQLVEAGVTEQDVVCAGLKRGLPDNGIEVSRTEIQTLLPYVHDLSDAVHDGSQQGANNTLLFAGRDAEILYDDYSVIYDDGALMPASKGLLLSRDMRRPCAARFFSEFGLTAAAVQDPRNTYTLIDTGFRGSVARTIDKWVARNYDVSLLEEERLRVGLVCAKFADSLGESIISYARGTVPTTDEALPHTRARMGNLRFGSLIDEARYQPEIVLATAFQLLPRYHKAFGSLVEIDGRATALPGLADGGQSGKNASIVDPLAAAVVQYHTVKSAMERK